MIAPIQQKTANGILTNIHSMNIEKRTVYPIRIDKKSICKLLGLVYTRELRDDGVFSDLWLSVLGMSLEVYNQRRKFSIEETRQIIAMLKVRSLIP